MKLPIELTPVENSSNLKAIGYDAAKEELYVEFLKTGDVWRYEGVSEGEWKLMNASDSKGSFFAKSIRPTHAGEKLPREAEEDAVA